MTELAFWVPVGESPTGTGGSPVHGEFLLRLRLADRRARCNETANYNCGSWLAARVFGHRPFLQGCYHLILDGRGDRCSRI